LVDDGLVDKEKIGGSNYFWSFPAKKDRLMELQHQKAIDHIETLKKTITETEAALMDAKRGREETDPSDDGDAAAAGGGTGGTTTGGTEEQEKEEQLPTRAKKLARLAAIAKDKVASEKELEGLRENDPQVLANLEKELQLVLQYVFLFCLRGTSIQIIKSEKKE
jgi:multidrug resistance efflux pump